MRWLFLFVLMLNLGYVGWQLLVADAPAGPVPASERVPSSVAPIVLLREASGDPGGTVLTDDGGGASADVTARPPVAGETPPTEGDPAALAASGQCFTEGPFREERALQAYVDEIEGYVRSVAVRERLESEQTLYWVYVPPQASGEAAQKLGKRLKAKKIKDFYIIRSGDKANGISLGHFRNRDGAYRLKSKAEKLGFEARVEPVFRSYTIYWLDYQQIESREIPASIKRKYLPDNASRLTRRC